MKLLLVGQDLDTKVYTCLTQTLIRGLKRSVSNFQTYDLSLTRNRYVRYFLRNAPFVNQWALNQINQTFFNYIKKEKFTHLLVIKGVFLQSKTLRRLRESMPNLIISCYNADDPFNPLPGSSNDEIRSSIPFYHHYFIWSHLLMRKLEEHNVGKAHYFPFAADPDIIYPQPKEKELFEVSFIGNADAERKNWMNQIIDAKQETHPIHVFGYHWHGAKGVSIHEPVIGKDYLKTLTQSKINVNILRKQNKNATNMRTFEIPAAGKFLLHEQSEGAEAFFESEKEAVYFSSPEEFVDKYTFYLRNDSSRKKIAEAGYQKILKSGFTYRNHIENMLKAIDH